MENTGLNDREKMNCAVRWLNSLYRAFAEESELEVPCERCRYFPPGCGVMPPVNFKVLEQFTGEGTVISPLLHTGSSDHTL